MLAVNMRSDKESVFSFRPAHSRFIAYPVGFLRRYLTGNKRLPDLITQNVCVLFLFPPCDGFVLSFGYLFNDTIENNILFGNPDATHEQVVDAAKRAQCHTFISALPKGYETIVGESGSTLSGGEKQRISIARAILKDAPIIILDEATSSIDPENEHELLAAIQELTNGKTLISIAHRLTTVRDANQILVIDKGKVAQKGTHDQLIEQEGIYRRFWKQREAAVGWKLEA